MEKKKVAPHALISGILFVLMAIVLVVDLISQSQRYRGISDISWYTIFTYLCSLLSTVGYVITAIALFVANRARPELLVIGFIIQAAVVVFVLIFNLVNTCGIYSVEAFPAGGMGWRDYDQCRVFDRAFAARQGGSEKSVVCSCGLLCRWGDYLVDLGCCSL